MYRRIVPLVLLAACAAPVPSTQAPSAVSDRVTLSSAMGSQVSGEVNVTDESYAQPVAAAPSRVFAALPSVFTSLGLSVTAIDSTNRVVKGEVLRNRRAFGGKTMAQLLDCGSTPAGPTAARYAINLTITSRVLPVAESASDVATVVQAVAVPTTTSGSNVRCRPNTGFAEVIARQLTQATSR